MEPLRKAKNFKGPQGPVVLVILDGVGIGTCAEGDVVNRANTPTLDRLAQKSVAAKLKAQFSVEPTLIAAGGGIFDVKVDDQLVYSKHQTGQFPDEDALVADLAAQYR